MRTVVEMNQSELCRMIHVWADPEMKSALDRAMGGNTKEVLDDPGIMKPFECMARRFNSTHSYAHVAPHDARLANIDPNMHVMARGSDTLGPDHRNSLSRSRIAPCRRGSRPFLPGPSAYHPNLPSTPRLAPVSPRNIICCWHYTSVVYQGFEKCEQ